MPVVVGHAEKHIPVELEWAVVHTLTATTYQTFVLKEHVVVGCVTETHGVQDIRISTVKTVEFVVCLVTILV